MSVDQNKSLVSWFLLESFNKRDLEVVDRVFAPDHRLHSPANETETVEGIEAVKEMIRDYFGIVGEGAAVGCTVLRQIAEGEWVSTYYALEAVNLTSGGPVNGAYRAALISRFADGTIQESFVVAQEADPGEERKKVFN
jgi:predicted SnoaL-like aldol condensation-catalyzing enzyme